jgi:hypothetical protein
MNLSPTRLLLGRPVRKTSRILQQNSPATSSTLARLWARTVLSPHRRCFRWTTTSPEAAQKKSLDELLTAAEGTSFAQDHGLKVHDDIDSYRKKVPIFTYDTMQRYIDRIVQSGEADVLIRGLPRALKRSSGSTGSTKFIPLFPSDTPLYPWLGCYGSPFFERFPNAIHGRQLFVTSLGKQTKSPGGVPIGPPNPDPIASLLFPSTLIPHAAPPELFYVSDNDLRLYCLLRLAAQEDLRVLAVVNPSTAVVFAQKLAAFADDLIEDLRTGKCAHIRSLPQPMQALVEKHLRADLAAAARLVEARRLGREPLATDLWPNLRVMFCWLGGSAALYRPTVAKLYPGVTCWDPRYSAVEGRFASMPEPESPSGVVNLWELLPEFIPEDESIENCGRTLLAHELQVNRKYKLIVSNKEAGLFRYYTHDIVECDGVYNRAPRIRFESRDHNTLSFTGEKVTEAHAVEAIRRVQNDNAAAIEYAAVSAEFGDPPRYILALETVSLSDERLPELARLFDDALCAVNYEYGQKRKTERLAAPTVFKLPKGTAARMYQKRQAQGALDGRIKLPTIVRDPAELRKLAELK